MRPRGVARAIALDARVDLARPRRLAAIRRKRAAQGTRRARAHRVVNARGYRPRRPLRRPMSKRDDLLTAARRFEAKAARTRRRRLAAQFEDVAAVLREVALD